MRFWLGCDVSKWWQREAFRAFNDGLIRHGERIAATEDEADVSVYWGDNAPPHMKNRPVLYLAWSRQFAVP